MKESGSSPVIDKRKKLIEETLQILQNLLKIQSTQKEPLLGLIYVFFLDQNGK
jgi:hypothetical protein